MKRFAVLSCLLASLIGLPVTAAILQLTPPDGVISGPPGSTVGWGYEIENDSQYYLVVDASTFCVGGYASGCTNPVGEYTDLIGPSFVVIAPFATAMQDFDYAAQEGLGSFQIFTGAMIGDSVAGDIFIVYSLYEMDPTVAPGDPAFSDQLVSQPAAVYVVPEPGTTSLLGAGLGAVAWLARRRRNL